MGLCIYSLDRLYHDYIQYLTHILVYMIHMDYRSILRSRCICHYYIQRSARMAMDDMDLQAEQWLL